MRILADYLRDGLKLIIVGFNPGEASARAGHYYAGRGNTFWPLMYESGLIPEPLEPEDDRRLLEFGIGLTDLVKRPSRGIEEIRREDYTEGRVILGQKLEQHAPRVIAFNGKLVYEKFSGRPVKIGALKEKLYGAQVYVLPSTSGQNTTETHTEKLQHFRQLAALVNGHPTHAPARSAGAARAKGVGRD
ncbi:MAG TPA: mismatch-specific DNA-glycosylase [Patescibacteria group bacterium]|nr:mismatch-specific DNA-glycosylase [Patescibacteria group bacterium]